ncbi:unannotated protein [freshwater metagenome]|uniref:Unannotated protein n=1 Tax=freshwater metagenome TaxID=449393 RepID=A0A6J7SKG2_9ZZZZ
MTDQLSDGLGLGFGVVDAVAVGPSVAEGSGVGVASGSPHAERASS